MRERVLRALGAVAAGFAVAWEHLTDRVPESVCECPARWTCPLCLRAMAGAPHVHEDDVIWPLDEEGRIMVTRLDGSDEVIFHDGGHE